MKAEKEVNQFEVKYIAGASSQKEISKAYQPRDVSQSSVENSGLEYIEPIYDLDRLVELTYKNPTLSACVASLSQGIYGVGFELKNRYPDLEKDSKHKEAIVREWNSVTEFLEAVDYTGTGSFNELMRKLGSEIESTGSGYLEILSHKGKPYSFKLIPSVTMRIKETDPEIVFWDKPFYDYDSQSYRWQKVPGEFKRYIQIDPSTGVYTYFKLLGDPRIVDSKTGSCWTKEAYEKLTKREQSKIKPANEIWHFNLYSPVSPYGLPRWTGAINSIVGSIYLETYNVSYIKNGLKAGYIIHSSIRLSEESLKQLENWVTNSMDLENSGKPFIISIANSTLEKILETDGNQPYIHFEKLEGEKDESWGLYDERNSEKIISSTRLSSVHVGKSANLNRATSQSMLETVENNTFLPSREIIDSFINMRIFPLLNVKYHKYISKPSTKQSLKDKAEIIEMLKDSGLTVRELRNVIAPLLSVQLTDTQENKENEYLDYPLGIAVSLIQNRNNIDKIKTE